ncbi:integrase [Mesorhizobium sp. LNHC221B00]|uniref:tyrosine-type recombinase/integrase n=1 Tax=Mesorhizobium sp. LNHC221B00 TaxID=1287233 RepID=UPI0003CF3E09|nr:tyrosine-type recombinase/integrase [Mesorhizobium sp. LNHC221B00]ESY81780.1 integrase [Mesorhizobium sp. LNHC221B00]
MAKVLKEAELTTAKARLRLPIGEHARRLDAEAHLYYRKGVRNGVWFARWRNWGEGANYKQAPVGSANDINDKPTDGLLTYLQAETRARQIVAKARAESKAAAAGPVLTVSLVVEAYIIERDARDSRRKGRKVRSDAGQRLRRYVLGQDKRGNQKAVHASPLASVALHSLTEKNLLSWRSELPDDLKVATQQRLINDLKAALNAAYAAHRERLDPTLPAIIKHGLKAEKLDTDEAVPLARDNQIMSASQVGAILAAAREVDTEGNWDGDLFRFVVLLAATGARFSQIARMKVGDVQRAQGRLMVPSSRKGKGGKVASVPVPVGKDVLDALLPATTGRNNHAILLERWRSEQVKGSIEWQRTGRSQWQFASELQRPWREIRSRAKLPTVIPYSLRHSSIVRGIGANLPIRLVAALHDTSVPMIERHYGRWIADGLEDLAAAAVVRLVPDEAANIVTLASRRGQSAPI